MRTKFVVIILILSAGQLFARQVIDLSARIQGQKDLTPVIYQVLQEVNCRDARLVFPPGTYHFYPDKAYGKYHHVTNHDNSYKYFAFPLEGARNIEIDGQGASFIFHDIITPFLIEDAEDIVLKNFSIDWEEPFYIQGKVVARNVNDKTLDMEFTSGSRFRYEAGRIVITSNGQDHPFLGEDMVFDPQTRAVAYRAEDYLLHTSGTKHLKAEKTGAENVFRISAPFTKEPAPEGMVYIFKGLHGSNRLAPAIHVLNSRNFSADKVTIYHAGGMGVIGEKSENISLREVHIMLREGSERLVSTTADATHFCNCKGELVIENCLFENMLDDATNVHGNYLKIHEILGSKSLSARIIHPQQFNYDFASPGDLIRLVEANTILPFADLQLKSMQKINHQYYVFEFEEDLPAAVKAGDGLENVTWYPTLTFRNNIVRNNRARSILISTKNKTLVENNTFSSMMTSILVEGDLNYWHESGAVEDLTIRNNIFYDNAYGGAKASVIWINPQMKEHRPGEYYEKNIRIENNEFRTFDKNILDAKSVSGLVFKDNTIKNSGTYPPIWGNRNTIELEHCTDVVIEGNKNEDKEKISVLTDSNTLSGSKIDKKADVQTRP